MPIPSRRTDESPNKFMSRCMSDTKLKEEFPDQEQRTAVCMSKATQNLDYMEAADFNYSYDSYGFEEEIDENNFVIPCNDDYIDVTEESLDWDMATEKPALWEHICIHKESEGENSTVLSPYSWLSIPNQSSDAAYLYENPKTGEIFTYDRQGVHKKDGVFLVYKGKASTYQGRTVKLNTPFRTPDGPKKFSVYVKNKTGNVIKVNFGDPKMEIRRDNPKRKKSFRARHLCDTDPGPKWKARYWACKMWE